MEAVITLSNEDVDRIASQSPRSWKDRKKASTQYLISWKLQLSRDTITDRIRKGQFGDVIRDGRTYRIPASGVQRYIAQHSGAAYRKAGERQFIRIHANPEKFKHKWDWF